MAITVGQVVGEYEVVSVIGHGGLGAVYGAKHLISQRLDAMKVLLPEQTRTAEMAERFRREIRLLAALNHPNIAGLHNAFYFDEQLVMIMEFVEGDDLKVFSGRGGIELTQLVGYAEQMLHALHYAHGRGVVHRDIKPANIMVTPAGVVKVLDFGIALTEMSTDLTATGSLIGSPVYMAPEQMQGKKATALSDIYSLGVTLYELIAGEPPFTGGTYELMMAHVSTPPKPLQTVRPDIPKHLSDAVGKALEKDPARRFQSAAEFLEAIQPGRGAPPSYGVTSTPPANTTRISTDQLTRPADRAVHTAETAQVSMLPADAVIKHLAGFIGPIARIVVNRIARNCTSADQLWSEAAKQIDSEADRQTFLRTRPR